MDGYSRFSVRRPRYSIGKHSSMPYAWTSYHQREAGRDIDILEIGNLVPYKIRTSRGHFNVSLDVRAENGRQNLSSSNYVEE